MKRVAVVGTSGSGKSTFGRKLAEHLGVLAVELDALRHQPGWTAMSDAEFRSYTTAIAAEDGWVIEGNYSIVRAIVWGRADTVVWLDLPKWQVMRRVSGRTLGRILVRRPLWHGNRERVSNLVKTVPAENIILWAWSSYAENAETYSQLMTDPAWQHLAWYRLRSPAEIRALLDAVAPVDA